MVESLLAQVQGTLSPDRLVDAVPEAEVEAPWGEVVSGEHLGVGVVEQVDEVGKVWVRWVGPNFTTWMRAEDLRPREPGAHLISIMQCDRYGDIYSIRHRAVATVGLKHNWKVELRPGAVIRTIRSDGSAWTFEHYPMLRRVNPRGTLWPAPPEDDDAEAFTVAELSVL